MLVCVKYIWYAYLTIRGIPELLTWNKAASSDDARTSPQVGQLSTNLRTVVKIGAQPSASTGRCNLGKDLRQLRNGFGSISGVSSLQAGLKGFRAMASTRTSASLVQA